LWRVLEQGHRYRILAFALPGRIPVQHNGFRREHQDAASAHPDPDTSDGRGRRHRHHAVAFQDRAAAISGVSWEEGFEGKLGKVDGNPNAHTGSRSPVRCVSDELDIPGLHAAVSRNLVQLEAADRHAVISNPANDSVAKSWQNVIPRRAAAQDGIHHAPTKLVIVLLGKREMADMYRLGRNRPMPRERLAFLE